MSISIPCGSAEANLTLFCQCVFEQDDIVELRLLPLGRQLWHTAADVPGLFGQLSAANNAGENIYAGVNPRREHGGSKSEDVLLARCLCSDWDNQSVDEVQRIIDTARLPPPTLLLHSGHGVHAYWRLVDPIADLAEWKILQKRFIATVYSDPSIHDPPRIMRLPGFWNVKADPAVPCYIIAADPSRRYPLVAFDELLPSLPMVSRNSRQFSAGAGLNDWVELLRGVPQGGRHNALVRLVGHYLGHGLSAVEVAVICQQWNSQNHPPLPVVEVDRAVNDLAHRRQAGAQNQVFRNRPKTIRLQLP
jgi:hypothetical protein